MEFDKKTIMIGVGIVLALALIYFYFMKSKKPTSSDSSSSGPTIYGTMTCPYTVKQTEKYPDYKFVDCSTGKCPDFVTAFPTTKHSDGKIEVGFS
jgi:hypothetical protein